MFQHFLERQVFLEDHGVCSGVLERAVYAHWCNHYLQPYSWESGQREPIYHSISQSPMLSQLTLVSWALIKFALAGVVYMYIKLHLFTATKVPAQPPRTTHSFRGCRATAGL